MFEIEEVKGQQARIRVIGVGGAGGNAVKILDRYLLGEFLRYLLFIAASFVALFLIIDFFEKTRMFLSNNATVEQIIFVCFGQPTYECYVATVKRMVALGTVADSLLAPAMDLGYKRREARSSL